MSRLLSQKPSNLTDPGILARIPTAFTDQGQIWHVKVNQWFFSCVKFQLGRYLPSPSQKKRQNIVISIKF